MAGEIEDQDDDEFDEDAEEADDGDDEDSSASPEDLAGEGDGTDDDIDPDALLDPKERASRSLEIRRQLEERDDERRLKADLDYLDDLDDLDD